jgi:hypothetical protein
MSRHLEHGFTILTRLGACPPALDWALDRRGQPARRVWNACPRGDWLLWLAAKLEVDRRLVVLAACDCARLALKHLSTVGDARPHIAIETAERWARGEATIEEVRAARNNVANNAFSGVFRAMAFDDVTGAYTRACNPVDAAAIVYATNLHDVAASAVCGTAAAITGYRSEASYHSEAVRTLRVCARRVRKRIPWALIEERAWPKGGVR